MLKHAFEELRESPYTFALAAIGLQKGLYETVIRPARPSTKAWGALALGVVAYEVLCPSGETLSEAYDSAIEKHPLIAKAAVGLVACHLANVLPPKYDLIHQGFLKLKEAL